MKTHWKKTMNPNYLGAYALEPNEDLVVEITEVKTESVMNADGRNEECLVAYLKDQKPLIVNKTNAKAIAKVAGSNYIEDWKGKQIALYISNVKRLENWWKRLGFEPFHLKPNRKGN